jgi:AraC-like DNA-binding protein/mannose-6-phosphate isomerase-like protein (cupin superfamily)
MSGTASEFPIVTAPVSLGRHDIALSGRELCWGMVDYLATNTSFSADPLNWHKHPGHELLFMIRGASGYQFEQGEEIELAGGHFMVIPPSTAHRGVRDIRGPSTVCAIILESRRKGEENGVFTTAEQAWMRSAFSAGKPLSRPMTPAMRQTARRLHESMVRHGQYSGEDQALLADLRLHAAFLILQAAREILQHERVSPIKVVERAKSYLSLRHAGGVTIDEVAEHVGCGRTRLYQAFKRETGMTPVDWLQRYRVGTALELLQTTDRTLMDIASAVGLTSAAYLCHIIKQYTGRTPGSHRRAAAGE